MIGPARVALAAVLSLLLAGCGGDPAPGEACTGILPQPQTLAGAQSATYAVRERPLRIHVFRPAGGGDGGGARPAILFFFGGGWRVGTVTAFEDQARAFARAGYVTALADYRVKCRDGTTPFAALADAQAAYGWLRERAASLGVNRDRIVLAGGSAGGQLALATAMKAPLDQKPAALLLFNPAVDLIGPAPLWAKLPARWLSPTTLSMKGLPPTLMFHGSADTRVPIASVRAFCRAAVARGRWCRFVRYEGQNHGFFHSQQPDPRLGRSPYADTLARAAAFLRARAPVPARTRPLDSAGAI